MGKTLPGAVNATVKMIPEAARLMERYQKEQERLALKFRRELEKLTPGQSLPPDDPQGTPGGDSSINSSFSEDSHETDGADNSSDDEDSKTPLLPPAGPDGEDNSSEDEDSKIPLPPPADPDKPATAAAPAKHTKLGLRAIEASKLKAKNSKAESKTEQGKENNRNVDKKQETNGIKPNSYSDPGRFLPPGYAIGIKPDGTVNGEGVDSEKKERIRASKMEFKRLDELYVFQPWFMGGFVLTYWGFYRYNKAIHDFYLAESTPSPSAKDDKWEEYIFVVRRRFGMYSFPKPISAP